MFPFLIQHQDIQVPTFFFMVMVAAMTTTFYLYWQAKKKGFSQIVLLDLGMLGTLFGIIGARLFHILFEAPDYYLEHPIRVFYFWQGGFVGYGVFIGIALAAFVYLKFRKLPLLPYVDLIALGCPLIVLLVRVGCIGAGCCYGKPTDFLIHLTFTNPASDAGHDFNGQSLHATQIYDLLNAAILFIVVNWFYARRQFNGQVALLFFMQYAFVRFFIEYLRGDEDRGVYFDGWLSTSQITGLVILILGSIFYFYWKKKYPIDPKSGSLY